VLRCLTDHGAARIETLATGPTRDLLEVAHPQETDLLAVEFRELGEKDGANRDVHAHAERVRSGDDLQESPLRELLDQ
jgi:hypothetical protein